MNNEQIKQVALQSGFKLKKQPDGTMDLNPYVYDFAVTLLNSFAYEVLESLNGNRVNHKLKEQQGKKDPSAVAED